MSKTLLISTIASVLCTGVLSAQDIYKSGDSFQVGSCNIHKWCQVEGGYVKGFLIKESEEKDFFTPKRDILYVYNRVKDLDLSVQKLLQEKQDRYIKTEPEQVNYRYGYIKKYLVTQALAESKKEKEIVPTVIENVPKIVKQEIKEVEEPQKIVQEELKEVKKPQKVVEVKKAEEPKKVVEAKIEKKPQTTSETKSDFFLTASVGYSLLDFSQTDDDRDTRTLINDSDDDAGASVGFGVGYVISENFFTTLKYSRTFLDNAVVENLLVGINYQFSDTYTQPYIGLSLGGGRLDWDNAMINGVEDFVSSKSEKFAYGLQVGAELDYSKHISFYGEYQLMLQSYETDITAANLDTTLTHKLHNTLSVGVRYFF